MSLDHSAPTVFIDFEGDSKNPPTFIGVLERDNGIDGFVQFILEETFRPLSTTSGRHELRAKSLEDILRDIDKKHGQNSRVYAWSSREQLAINEILATSDIASSWENRVIDAKKLAKTWARHRFPNHEFTRTEFRGRHTLDQYLKLIEYDVPVIHGPGKTGSRIRAIRALLQRGKPYDTWTPVQKRYWANLLAHNKHDCYGMMALIDRVVASQNEQK